MLVSCVKQLWLSTESGEEDLVNPYCLQFVTVVNAREWCIYISRCSNHTVTCPVLTVTWIIDGFSRSQDLRCMRSGKTTPTNRLVHTRYCAIFSYL